MSTSAVPQLTDIERTCLFTCRLRYESSLQHSLDTSFDESILNALDPDWRNTPDPSLDQKMNISADWVAARTMEIDSIIAHSSPDITQIVLLGCGMDPRPWRAKFPSNSGRTTLVYEVDSGSVMSLRSRAVSSLGDPSGCVRRSVVGDLEKFGEVAKALRESGLDSCKPVLWVAEGLLGYLESSAMDGLLSGVRESCGDGSTMIATAPPSPSRRRPYMRHKVFEDSDATAERARRAGWPNVRVIPCADIIAKYHPKVADTFVQDLLLFSH